MGQQYDSRRSRIGIYVRKSNYRDYQKICKAYNLNQMVVQTQLVKAFYDTIRRLEEAGVIDENLRNKSRFTPQGQLEILQRVFSEMFINYVDSIEGYGIKRPRGR